MAFRQGEARLDFDRLGGGRGAGGEGGDDALAGVFALEGGGEGTRLVFVFRALSGGFGLACCCYYLPLLFL